MLVIRYALLGQDDPSQIPLLSSPTLSSFRIFTSTCFHTLSSPLLQLISYCLPISIFRVISIQTANSSWKRMESTVAVVPIVVSGREGLRKVSRGSLKQSRQSTLKDLPHQRKSIAANSDLENLAQTGHLNMVEAGLYTSCAMQGQCTSPVLQ
jgi:hypothetical protein